MKEVRKIFALSVFLLVILMSLSFYTVKEWNLKEQEIIAKANLISLQYPQEKIYLHLDRPTYWASEDIWFKAYLLNTAIPDCNLYVELLNSSGEVIDKKICWAQNGLAYGDFHLANNVPGGVYQIRAYTNWMRNFDNNWFFRKNIVIRNLRDRIAQKASENLKSKDIDLQFFPEGGTLVSNVKNRVAFKAIDKNGKGVSVEGEIVDEGGNKITDFKSGFKGMGSFVFEPQEGGKYKAQSIVAHKFSINTDLPLPNPDAVKLTVAPNDSEKIHIQISIDSLRSGNNQKLEFLIIGQTGGQVCYRKEITSSTKSINLDIEKKSLPTGIIKFTVFDREMIPCCERLVFVNHRDYVSIDIEPDKLVYLTREKIQLDVKAITNSGIPCLANLSTSVYNPELLQETEEYPNNILTQFLLKSELKGNIEEPAWYFKDDSLSTLTALDNLMLTQGYRYFEWKEIIFNKTPEITYQPEESLQLRGKVSNWLTKKPVKNCKVTMMFVKSLLAVHEQTTDSLGNFLFSDLFFNDTVIVSLQAGNKKERRNNWIDLDNRSAISPEAVFLPVSYHYNNENQFVTTYYLSETDSDLIDRQWRLSDTVLLGDINIMAKKPVEETIHLRPYNEADYVFDINIQEDIYIDIFDMLYTTSAYMRNFLEKAPQLYLDGVPVDGVFVDGLPASWFEKVEAVRMAPVTQGFGPALFFYTKRGETRKKELDGIGMKSGEIVGYSVIRSFYYPAYKSTEPVDVKTDFRTTLYWNPIVRTDSTGVAQVSFYNSDETGKMQVVVEGITADGKLCRGLGSYFVKE